MTASWEPQPGRCYITPESHLWPAARFAALGTASTSPGRRPDPADERPSVLWVRGRGDLAELTAPAVSIVGSRVATERSLELATRYAAELAEAGVTVVSGGALGVDTAAHTGAISRTVVVLPCGLDCVYPHQNAELFDGIVDHGGLVIAEYPPPTTPSRERFLHRNRVIAALGAATLVVESGMRSGTLNTARTAHRIGRSVWAVPGSPGCDALIRDDMALPCTSIAAIITATISEADAR